MLRSIKGLEQENLNPALRRKDKSQPLNTAASTGTCWLRKNSSVRVPDNCQSVGLLPHKAASALSSRSRSTSVLQPPAMVLDPSLR
jgi:hypothetical protein